MYFQALGTRSALSSSPFDVSIGHFLPQKKKKKKLGEMPVLLKYDFLKDILFILVLFLTII